MTRWIAEIGSNHCGSLERANNIVLAAHSCGFTDVKTQAWTVDTLFAPGALTTDQVEQKRLLEVPWWWHKELANTARTLGMGYGVSVFYRGHVHLAAKDADWLKVSSYSILDARLLRAVAEQPKDVIVSTGMATESEVAEAESFFRRRQLELMHCVSSYPARAHEANLRSIQHMRDNLFGRPVGWSDHTLSPHVVARAVCVHGASSVELHFDLDDGIGVETAHSWSPSSLPGGCGGFEDGRLSDAYGPFGYYACDGKHRVKAPSVSEYAERDWRADPSDGMRPMMHVRKRQA